MQYSQHNADCGGDSLSSEVLEMVPRPGKTTEDLLTDRGEPKAETFKVGERQTEPANVLTWVLEAKDLEIWSIGRVKLDGFTGQ